MKTIQILEKEPGNIDYVDVMELGFERGQMNDSVFKNQFGYDDFWVEKKFTDHIGLVWEHRTRTCELNIYDDRGYIVDKYYVDNLVTLRLLIDMFNPKDKSDG